MCEPMWIIEGSHPWGNLISQSRAFWWWAGQPFSLREMHHHCPLSQLPVRPIFGLDPEPGRWSYMDIWRHSLKEGGICSWKGQNIQTDWVLSAREEGYQEATWPQRSWVKQCRSERPALTLEDSSFRVQISKTQAFQLLLLNLMDFRNKTFLMMLLFDFLEIFNQDLFGKCCLFSVLPTKGKTSESGVAGHRHRCP